MRGGISSFENFLATVADTHQPRSTHIDFAASFAMFANAKNNSMKPSFLFLGKNSQREKEIREEKEKDRERDLETEKRETGERERE